MLDGKPLESPKSGSRISIFWATLDDTTPSPQPPRLCTRAAGSLQKCVRKCYLPPWPGPQWAPSTSPVLHTPSTPFSALRSPLQAGHLLTKASLGHTPVCGLTHTHLHVCQITPFPAKPSFTPPLVEVISLSWSTHVLWGPFHSGPELQSSHWG